MIKLFSRYRTAFFFIVLLWVLYCQPVHAQEKLRFNHITAEEGLSNRSVLAVSQDAMGFMWAGTMDGLNRYDGKTIRIYRSFYESNPMSPSIKITSLVSGNGYLWIGTNNGLYAHLPGTDSFYRVPTAAAMEPTGNTIKAIFASDSGSMLIAAPGGLSLIKTGPRFIAIPVKAASGTDDTLLKNIQYISSDSSGNILLGTAAGLYACSKAALHQNQAIRLQCIRSHINVSAIACDRNHQLWVGTQNAGVYLFTAEKKLAHHYTAQNGPQGSVVSNTIRKILCSADGRVWIGTLKGLNIYNPTNQTLHTCTNDPDDPQSLNFNSIHDIFQDQQGNVWIGTFFGGLNMTTRYQTPFTSYQNNRNANSISSNIISSILGDASGNLWIGTEAEGINYFNRTAHRFTHLKNDGTPFSISSNLIKAMLLDEKNRIWVGFFNGELNVIDSLHRTIERIRQTNIHAPPDADDIITLAQDGHGNIWIGNEEAGVNIYDPVTRSFHTFDEAYPGKKLSSNAITHLYRDSKNNMWIGTKKGLNVLYAVSGQLVQYTRENTNPRLLSDYIYCITEDQNQVIWFGSYSGLSFLNPATAQPQTFTTQNGLSGSKVVGIVADDQNHLWISTNNGISRLDAARKQFTVYNTQDGLPGQAFNYNSRYRDQNGSIFFGGYNGLVSFDPRQIEANPVPPPVELVEMTVNGAGFKIPSPSRQAPALITLSHDENNLVFHYAVLNFIKPEKNRSAYKLEGFDQQWNYTGAHTAAYSNLPPGNYTLLIKAANNDGVWNLARPMARFTIRPPLWKTWWAYTLYALAFLLATGAVFWFLQSRASLKRKLEYEHALNVKQRELQQMKTDFFTHVSHEIRTPLTMIMGPAEMLLDNALDRNSEKKLLASIKSNADRMLKLSNDLLDFMKADSGYTQLHPVKNDLVAFCRDVFEKFSVAAAEKNIRYRFDAAAPAIDLYFDPHYMEIVFYNLLSNALKFTPPGGRVSMQLIMLENGDAEISICDNGAGIPPESSEKIFTQFFQVDAAGDKKTGTGIGLALSKILVTLHGGNIRFTSTLSETHGENKTCFFVSLKGGQDHFLQPGDN
ncbi:ATP-binding protein [Niabella pedocola]|uniref:histidine kinase n=1 Tax=Niabella pedocola TaxID=1752077 RepID=A0ABS8PZP4_9BACT|nr:sensor histidine kinase [Niabella pedocola]MCD2425406.1 ATP-binding protein [Niabella pedocola]